MQPVETCKATYPADSLKEWAKLALGVERCSTSYLKTLAIVLGNMARADQHNVRLLLTTVVPWASRQTMRTLLEQLCAAQWITRWRNPKKAIYAYRGCGDGAIEKGSAAMYIRMQRDAEAADFQRYTKALGIVPEDCPF